MKKSITFEWGGDGPESWNPGTSVTIEIDFTDFLDGMNDEEYLETLEKEVRAFGKSLAIKFDADSAMTDQEIKEVEKWCDEEMKKQ